jgi:hypothetical protein
MKKKYHLRILLGTGDQPFYDIEVIAYYLEAKTKNSVSVGCYSFYCNESNLVASYPIDRTVISKIEYIKQNK